MKQINSELEGRFRLTVIKPDGTERLRTDWFDNLILNQGLNYLGTGPLVGYCHIGNGTTPPVSTDTGGLQSRLAVTSTVQANETGNSGGAPWFGFNRVRYRFAAAVSSITISEVGVGPVSGNVCFSRALVSDGSGTPLTITIGVGETLDVEYELRIYPPTADVTGTATIGGASYDYIIRASEVDDQNNWLPFGFITSIPGITTFLSYGTTFSGDIGAITGAPTGTQQFQGTIAKQAYVDGSYSCVFRANYGLNDANIAGGIRSILMRMTPGSFQIQFNPKIPKDNTKTLYLDFRFTWSRRTL